MPLLTRLSNLDSMPSRLTSIAMALAGSFASASLAQVTEPPPASPTVSLPSVVVSGSPQFPGLPLDDASNTSSFLGLTLRETPATIDVLTQQQMLAIGARSTLDALNVIPGVSSANAATSPGLLSMRGFTGSAIGLNYDGAKPSVPAFFTREMDSWSFERIEVLKGPSSVLFGEGALAGTVNLIPKRPRLGVTETSALASVGSFDTVRLAADTNVPLGERAALRAVASWSDSGGYVDDTGSSFFSGTLAVRFVPVTGLTIDLAADYYRDDYDTAYFGTPLVPFAAARDPSSLVSAPNGWVLDAAMRDKNYNVLDATTDSETTWLRSGVEYKVNDNWTLRNILHFYHSDRTFKNAEFFGYNQASGLIDRSTGIVTHDFDYWIERLVLAGDSTIAGMRNRIAAGAEYNHVKFFTQRRFGSTTAVSQFDPNRGQFPAGDNSTVFPSRTDNDVRIGTAALFVEDALNITPGWLVLAGARYDHIDLDRTSTNLNTGAAALTDRTYNEVTYRIGTTFDLQPKTQLFASYSTAVVPPGALLSLTPANSQFDMTTGEAAEGGIKSTFLDNRVDVTLAGYWIKQDDIVTRSPTDPTVAIQGGSQSSRGVELALSAIVTPQIRIDANAALLRARFDELIEAGGANRAGNVPARIPERTANLFGFYYFDAVPVTLSAAVHYAGPYYTDNANTIRVGGTTTLDAGISYRFKNTELTLRGRNLTNELYADYTDISPDQLTISPPRSVELTLLVRL